MKKLLALALVLCLAFSLVATLAGCDSGADPITTPPAETTETPPVGNLETIGSAVKYDPNVPVNNGDPITIEFWHWDNGAALLQPLVDQYTAIHPNVTIKLVENPWNDFWTKLPLALQGNDGPAIFLFHNSQHDNTIGYMAPYEIALEDLEADYIGVSSHVIDGKVYYTDYGFMTVTMYYNADMWEAAGLTDQDIPKTWDEFREVAKKLTIRDEAGNLVQAGFSYNGPLQGALGMQYQYGQNLFTSDNKVTLNNDAQKKFIQLLLDLYEVDGVGDLTFGENAGEDIGTGLVAMTLGWGFMNNIYGQLYPDLNFKCFELPAPTSDVPYAYYRNGGEASFGVNKNASTDQQAVAQDIVRFFLANDTVLKGFCLTNAVFPAKMSLQNDADILAIPALGALVGHIDRYINTGNYPAIIETNFGIAMDNIFYNGMDITKALQEAENTINAELAANYPDFVSIEHLYKYASEAIGK